MEDYSVRINFNKFIFTLNREMKKLSKMRSSHVLMCEKTYWQCFHLSYLGLIFLLLEFLSYSIAKFFNKLKNKEQQSLR